MRVGINNRTRGMTMVEVLATVAILGLIAAVAAWKISDVKGTAEETRLTTHVASLNAAVRLYVNSGGSLEGLTSAQAVVDKMKTLASNGEKMAGFSGTFVDPRLTIVEQTSEEGAVAGALRVIWDETAQTFRIADSGQKGIKEFKIDPSVTPDNITTEERDTLFELAVADSQGAWVWDFDHETEATASTIETSTGGNESLDLNPTGTTYAKQQLLQPSLDPAPGSYGLEDYGTGGKLVVVNNPNSNDDSEILVSVNGGYWMVVQDGGSVEVPPGGTLAVFAHVKESALASFYSSYVRSGLYEATTTSLTSPSIVTSAPSFHPLDTTAIIVTISHGNAPEHGKVIYRVGENEWQDYDQPFSLDIANHLAGTSVVAKSVATQWPEYYLESPESVAPLPTEIYTLDPPTIATSASELHPLTSDEVTFTLTDPNETTGAISQLQYALNGGDWVEYEDVVTVSIDDYSDGLTITSKAIPTIYAGAIVESSEATQVLDAIDVTLQSPSIALSRSAFHPMDHLTLTVTLSNPNAGAVSDVSYSIDDGATWVTYVDPFEMDLLDHLSGATVITHATPTAHPANLFQSADASQEIGVDEATLVVPTIASSAPVLNPQGYPTATITLNNPNNSAFSKVTYSLDSEGTWQDYADPFDLSVTEYPEGVTIIARSEPTVLPELITISDHASTTLPVPPKLEMPTFSRVAGGYVKSQFDAGIVINNPNASADSVVKFRVDDGPWLDYTLPLVLTSWPATVQTYAAAADYMQYQNSDTNEAAYERIYLTPDLAFEMDASGLPNLIHEFTGEAFGEFKDPLGGSDMVYIIDNNYFEFGESTGYLGFENGNWLEYTGASWDGVQAGELFRLGTLDYFNGTTWGGTHATGITLELTIVLSMPNTNQTFDINLDLESTTNLESNTADENADYVRIGDLSSNFSTTIDGIQYNLNLAFGYNGANGFTTVDEFHVHEAATATADLWGFFSSEDF